MIGTIVLPAGVTAITARTEIHPEIEVSKNFTLHDLLCKVTNAVTLIDPINPITQTLATKVNGLITEPWKVVSNIQHLANGVLEPMLDAFGKDLVINCAYLNPTATNQLWDGTNSHFAGTAADMFVAGFAGNMYPVISEAVKAIGQSKVSELGLLFNNHSWMHVGVNTPFGANRAQPKVWTWDLQSGQQASSIFPLRGGIGRGVTNPPNHLTDGIGNAIGFTG